MLIYVCLFRPTVNFIMTENDLFARLICWFLMYRVWVMANTKFGFWFLVHLCHVSWNQCFYCPGNWHELNSNRSSFFLRDHKTPDPFPLGSVQLCQSDRCRMPRSRLLPRESHLPVEQPGESRIGTISCDC